MKQPDSASVVNRTVGLPPSVTSYLVNSEDKEDDAGFINGGILEDTRYAWMYSGSKFAVIDLVSGQKIAAWTFGAVLRDFKTRVTCVCELSPLLPGTQQLLVGLECDVIGGVVCVFHCQGSRVLRAVRVDRRVTGVCATTDFPAGPLRCFDGVALVATHGGTVLAMDLNRESCVQAILNGSCGNESLLKDELNMANLVVLSIDDIDLILEQRQIACNKDDHIAIQVNEGCTHNLHFIMHNPDNTVRLREHREHVYVSCMLHVPQLGGVFIGFNVGGFQLWNLLTLELEYTSPLNADGLPITHFGFLEPCDDPRAFCYLWVIYSTTEKHEEGFPLAAMYALTYQDKSFISEGVSLYQNFITCHLRFNMELTSAGTNHLGNKQMVGGRNLACRTLSKAANKSEDGDESVLNICQIVWECWAVSAITPIQSTMVLFDIDQWYKEQMPDCSPLETNSYMSVVNLGDTLAHTANSYICDVRINKETVSPYYSVQRLEEHFYPNALAYDCYCLTSTDITQLSTMGVQRQLIASISEVGGAVLLQPKLLFQQCMNTGMLPIAQEPTPSLQSSLTTQRQIILSIALEARLVQFLSSCAVAFSSGNHISAGCSLQLITDWCWARALALKRSGDILATPLFDHSGGTPDRNAARLLDDCTRQLGHLASLLSVILEKCAANMLPAAIEDISHRQKAVNIVSQYFRVVQWFLNVGLLPEFNVDHPLHLIEDSNERLPYPVESLIRFYQNRRFKLHCLNDGNPANENLQNKSCDLLFIDQFIKVECAQDKLKQIWIEDSSEINGLYPPPSLHSLLRTYLIPDIKEEHKHSLVLYVLVDYAMMFDDNRYEGVIRRLMQFPTMFGLSNTDIKITEAFWHLDHRNFEFALVKLQCVLAGGCLSQWQHNVVLSSLLAQKRTQSALQYLHVRGPLNASAGGVHDDWETCCNLYLSRGLVVEAYNLIKDSLMHGDTADEREKRFIIFFEGCRKMSLLSKVLLLPFTREQEDTLVKFLKAVGDSDTKNLLVLYYLKRCRYIEAQQANDDLKMVSSKGQLPYNVTSDFSSTKTYVHKGNTRDTLVDLYCKTLPQITRHLAQYASGQLVTQKPIMPTPITVNLQATLPKPASYKSSFIQATIDKASETWMDKPVIARGIKRALQVEETPFICTPRAQKHATRLQAVEKMSTTPDDSPPSSKKPRLEDGAADTSKLDAKLVQEMQELLHTPVVERKSRWGVASTASGRCSTDVSTLREATPQSILKVRKILDSAVGSPVDFRLLAETDDELETVSQHSQSDNLSRSIRFNIPTASNTPSPTSEYVSEFNDSFNELCHHEDNIQNASKSASLSVGGSPRKSIHHSCDAVMHASFQSVNSTPIKDNSLRRRHFLSGSLEDNNIEAEVNEDPYFSPISIRNISQTKSMKDISPNAPLQPDLTSNEVYSNVSSQVTVDADVTRQEEAVTKEIVVNDDAGSDVEEQHVSPPKAKGPQARRSIKQSPQRKPETPTVRRSLRSRSRTPELEIKKVVSSVSKTTKSLARRVMEANALSVTTEIINSTCTTKTEVETSNDKADASQHGNSIRQESVDSVASDIDVTLNSKFNVSETKKYLDLLHTQNIADVSINSVLESDISEENVTEEAEPTIELPEDAETVKDDTKNDHYHIVETPDENSKESNGDSNDNEIVEAPDENELKNVPTRNESYNFEVVETVEEISSPDVLLEKESIEETEKQSVDVVLTEKDSANDDEMMTDCELKEDVVERKPEDVEIAKDETKNDHYHIIETPDENSKESNENKVDCVAIQNENSSSNDLVIDMDEQEAKDAKMSATESAEASLEVSSAEESVLQSDDSDVEFIGSEQDQGFIGQNDASSDSDDSKSSSKEDSEGESDSEESSGDEKVQIEDNDEDDDQSEDEVEEKQSEEDSESHESMEEETDSNSKAESDVKATFEEVEILHSEESTQDTLTKAHNVKSQSKVSPHKGNQEEEEEVKPSEEAAAETDPFGGEDLEVVAMETNEQEKASIVENAEHSSCYNSFTQSYDELNTAIGNTDDVTIEKSETEDVQCVELKPETGESTIHEEDDGQSDPLPESSVFNKAAIDTSDVTKESIANLSLMTEEGSNLEDSAFQLRYEPDEKVESEMNDVLLEKNDVLLENNEVLLEKNDVPLEKNDISLEKNDVSLEKNDTSLVKNDVPLEKNDTSLVKNDVSLEKNDISLEKNDVLLEKKEIVLQKNDVIEEEPAKLENERKEANEKESIEVTVENVSATKESEAISKENVEIEKWKNILEANASTPVKQTPQKRPRKTSSSSSKKKDADRSLNDSGAESVASERSIARSTRSSSKNKVTAASSNKFESDKKSKKALDFDDAASVASDASSRYSTRSKNALDSSIVSESSVNDELESRQVNKRKSRRSVMALNKPNLSVIPEMSNIEEVSATSTSRKENTSRSSLTMESYSTSRRLTRTQKSMLERSMDSPMSGQASRRSQRPPSSLQSIDGSVSSSEASSQLPEVRTSIPVEEIDPIQLLDKQDFKGSPDLEEAVALETSSVSSRASSVVSDLPKTKPGRLKRAVSETGCIEALRKSRRPSTDFMSPITSLTPVRVVSSPPRSLDTSVTESPSGRPRRRSFNRANEALTTPKRNRRTSTEDLKSETDGDHLIDVPVSERLTPENQESQLAAGSKLEAILEDDAGIVKPNTRRRKAASIHGYAITSDLGASTSTDTKPRRPMSRLLSPVPNEENPHSPPVARRQSRRKTRTYKAFKLLQYTINKK